MLTFLDELKKHLLQNPLFLQLRREINDNPTAFSEYLVYGDLILKEGRIWLSQGFSFIPTLLIEYHSNPNGDHMGIAKTMAKVMENFDWPGLRKDVQ